MSDDKYEVSYTYKSLRINGLIFVYMCFSLTETPLNSIVIDAMGDIQYGYSTFFAVITHSVYNCA